jgi:hypothetical protein
MKWLDTEAKADEEVKLPTGQVWYKRIGRKYFETCHVPSMEDAIPGLETI